MPGKTKIEWATDTWNPVTGCHKVSPGCKNCYAETLAERFRGVPGSAYEMGFDLTLRPERLEQPLRWAKPRRIFVNSMSDLFHKDIPVDYVQQVFDVMNKAHWHTFQILTKRHDILLELDQAGKLRWAPNIWMGVSVENADYRNRIDYLRDTKAHIKFLSIEPLIGPCGALLLDGIDWVIVGGESGPGSRPIKESWVTSIRDQCIDQNVPFFFKQWGGTNKKATGRLLEGREWNEYPVTSCPWCDHDLAVSDDGLHCEGDGTIRECPLEKRRLERIK